MMRELMRAAREHWPEAAMEAACLGAFMISAGVVGTLLEAPASPLRAWIEEPVQRRVLGGLAMGLTAVALIYSPWGRRSGAHMNPSVTLTFLRLGKIARADAVLYVVAQILGGVAGVLLVRTVARTAFTAPPVNSVTTVPGPRGPAVAFLAEASISFLLMTAVLVISNRERWMRWTGVVAGTLVALYITFEAPLSGMSMNPARSLASAWPSGIWASFWIYLLAPPAGMLLAGEVYRRIAGLAAVRCAKFHHTHAERCIFFCGWDAGCGQTPKSAT